jgi:hypothetical protein
VYLMLFGYFFQTAVHDGYLIATSTSMDVLIIFSLYSFHVYYFHQGIHFLDTLSENLTSCPLYSIC